MTDRPGERVRALYEVMTELDDSALEDALASFQELDLTDTERAQVRDFVDGRYQMTAVKEKLIGFRHAIDRYIADDRCIQRATDEELVQLSELAALAADSALPMSEVREIAAKIAESDQPFDVPELIVQSHEVQLYWAKDLYREMSARGTEPVLRARDSVELLLRKRGEPGPIEEA